MGMSLSLIIATRNRAEQLTECLAAVAAAVAPECPTEIVVVDNGSTDATRSVIRNFALASPFKTKYVFCPTPGVSSARNAGIASSSGKWLLFTDDDCYIEAHYFVNFFEFVKKTDDIGSTESPISYGSGQIHFYDPGDDARLAHLYFHETWLIPKHSLLSAGAVQGANMFFERKVFDTIGGFDGRIGAGTPFPCEDIELAGRASLAGFVGARIPVFKVFHHHRRPAGSAEADAVVEAYDYGRGAYYASLLDKGLVEAWQIWASACGLENDGDRERRMRLARELEGAAAYLTMVCAPPGGTGPGS
jgi:glycosyltransferase involved in cell wall biosynthesis